MRRTTWTLIKTGLEIKYRREISKAISGRESTPIGTLEDDDVIKIMELVIRKKWVAKIDAKSKLVVVNPGASLKCPNCGKRCFENGN